MIKMPVIAESPPLLYGDTTEEPYVQPVQPTQPVVTQPVVSPPAVIIHPTQLCNTSDILANHRIFIGHIDDLGACFKREQLPEFNDIDFELHSKIALMDKYITKNNDMYCSTQALHNLSQTLKRFED